MQGLWHETFHCWFVSKIGDSNYIYLQIRSDSKKDYPNLLDITAAGHLLANETVRDGTREIQEELGIQVLYNELISLGIIKDCIINDSFIDKEMAHVFLYLCDHSFNRFVFQEEEVSGMVRVDFDSFCELLTGKRDEVRVTGYGVTKKGKRVPIDKMVTVTQFVPHQMSYCESIIQSISKKIKA